MADDVSSAVGDVTQADLGNFINQTEAIHDKITLGIWGWIKSVVSIIMAIFSLVVVATLKIVPMIFALLAQAIDVITGTTMPTAPDQIPGSSFLAIANTFFPIDVLFSSLGVYYTIFFGMLFIRVVVSISKFGLKYTIQIWKILIVP